MGASTFMRTNALPIGGATLVLSSLACLWTAALTSKGREKESMVQGAGVATGFVLCVLCFFGVGIYLTRHEA